MLLVGVRDDEHRALAPSRRLLGSRPPVTASLIRPYWVAVGVLVLIHEHVANGCAVPVSDATCFVALQQFGRAAAADRRSPRAFVGGPGARGVEPVGLGPSPCGTQSLRLRLLSTSASQALCSCIADRPSALPYGLKAAWDPSPASWVTIFFTRVWASDSS